MRQSKLFTKTLKATPKGAVFISHQLLLRGGFIYQIASGMYALLPLGFRVFRRIENIIRKEFDKIGIQELLMSLLHPAELWKRTGRFETAGQELWKIKSRKGEEMVLAMTHEETIAAIAANTIRSESELPVIVNQFQTKIRDEERPRGGLLRLREFFMQDAYSFDKNEKGLNKSFQKMVKSYKKIFSKMELPVIPVEASSGLMGGLSSSEFMVITESGEDKIAICPKCKFAVNVEILRNKGKCPQCGTKMEIKKTIEVAHAFKLGTKYSKVMNILYEDRKGERHFVQMGCYGIGLERAMATLVEVHHDKKGIIWPSSVTPFDVHLLSLKSGKKAIDEKIKKTCEKLYQDLKNSGIEVLYDDREDKSPGEKFADADLIGILHRVVVSKRTIGRNSVEVKRRDKNKMKLVKVGEVRKFLMTN
ncbi:MAG: His/Gly/Thr/Pro-type tRNA ligase C-terminal domain-containing protein [Patescibacteria group bacterium]|nr:His/Gly/Thr/Pro-type tRNA ligase C-terminal domain-containing protein [Patescibacteria group bacterium]